MAGVRGRAAGRHNSFMMAGTSASPASSMMSDRPADSHAPASPPADDWQDDGNYASGAPEHDFAVRRMTLIVLLVAAIVLPCIYVVVMAYNDLKTREAAASDVTMRTVRVAEEHALKVFDLSETLDARIVDLVQDMDDATVRNRGVRHPRSAEHDRRRLSAGGRRVDLRRERDAAREQPLLSGALCVDREPRRLRRHPRRQGHRTYLAADDGAAQAREHSVFNTGVARRHSDGSFAGMVSIALKSSYFNAFYRDLLGGASTPMTMALARSDGAVIASYPPPPALAHRSRRHVRRRAQRSARRRRARHDGASSEIAYRRSAATRLRDVLVPHVGDLA